MPDLAEIEKVVGEHVAFDLLLRKEPLGRDDDVFAAGFDSMSLSRFLVFVERRFGVVIPDHEVVVDEVSTVAKMARFVEGWISRERSERRGEAEGRAKT